MVALRTTPRIVTVGSGVPPWVGLEVSVALGATLGVVVGASVSGVEAGDEVVPGAAVPMVGVRVQGVPEGVHATM